MDRGSVDWYMTKTERERVGFLVNRSLLAPFFFILRGYGFDRMVKNKQSSWEKKDWIKLLTKWSSISLLLLVRLWWLKKDDSDPETAKDLAENSSDNGWAIVCSTISTRIVAPHRIIGPLRQLERFISRSSSSTFVLVLSFLVFLLFNSQKIST